LQEEKLEGHDQVKNLKIENVKVNGSGLD